MRYLIEYLVLGLTLGLIIGEPFDLFEEVDNLVMNVNIHCFLGKDVREKYAKTFRQLYEELEKKGTNASAVLLWWLPWGNAARCTEIRKTIIKIIEPIIIERQKQYLETGEEQIDYLNEYIITPHKKSKEPWTICEMVERYAPSFTSLCLCLVLISYLYNRTLAIFFAARINTMKSVFWTALGIATRPDIVYVLPLPLPVPGF